MSRETESKEDYFIWREKHRQTHTIISDLEEKKRLLSEQVKIQKLNSAIEKLEATLQNYLDSDSNIASLTQLERHVLKIIYDSSKPLDRLEVWDQIRQGDPETFVSFARLHKMGFIKRSGFTKWKKP